jgi:hypothetical protein
MKYTLIAEDTWNGSKTTREFEVDTLSDTLCEIELFLKGAGFVFNGNLDFINDFDHYIGDDDFTTTESDYELTEQVEHSEYYFDFDRNQPASTWPFPTASAPKEETNE